jgi:hypothetical protein
MGLVPSFNQGVLGQCRTTQQITINEDGEFSAQAYEYIESLQMSISVLNAIRRFSGISSGLGPVFQAKQIAG